MSKIKEIYCNDVKFSQYSLWHRQQTHSCVAMMDVDKVECCMACNEPLFLAETVKFVGQDLKKGHSMIRQLAIKAGLPAFLLWYHFVGEMPMWVYVKKINEKYIINKLINLKINPNHVIPLDTLGAHRMYRG